MSDLSFLQQLAVSAAGGISAATAVGVVGYFFLRGQQRIRWQEQGQGELARIKQKAMIEMIEALGAYIDARANTLRRKKVKEENKEPFLAEEYAIAVDEALEHQRVAWERLQTASVARWLLVPHRIGESIQIAAAKLSNAKSGEEMGPVIANIARELEPYLPKLGKRWIWHSEWPEQ